MSVQLIVESPPASAAHTHFDALLAALRQLDFALQAATSVAQCIFSQPRQVEVLKPHPPLPLAET